MLLIKLPSLSVIVVIRLPAGRYSVVYVRLVRGLVSAELLGVNRFCTTRAKPIPFAFLLLRTLLQKTGDACLPLLFLAGHTQQSLKLNER